MRAVLVVLGFLLAIPVASADVPSPDEEVCMGKQVGEACGGGVCAETKCARTRPGPDGTMQTNEWTCVKCVAGTPTLSSAGVADGGGSGSPLRIALGILVAVVVLGGGVWLAYRRGVRGRP